MVEKTSRPRAIEHSQLTQLPRFLISAAALATGVSVLYVLLRA